MKQRIYQFMQGRYGADQLTRFICIFSIILLVVEMITGFRWLGLVVLALLILTYWRALSRNTYKRAAENEKYLQISEKLFGGIRKKFNRFKQRKVYAFYRCPDCRQTVRVPRGKGRIEITCPKCHAKFIKKT